MNAQFDNVLPAMPEVAVTPRWLVSALMWCGVSVLAVVGGHSNTAHAQVCARVKIEIVQELTLERQAFDAKMKITNGLKTLSIEDIGVEVSFQDAQGNPVEGTSDPNDPDASFFITPDSATGVSGDVSTGSGSIAPDTAGELHWLIIPAPGAAGPSEEGTLYFVGATVTYTLGGEVRSVEVVPDSIYVRPMPQLHLDYFLPEQVHSDNPYTPLTEPPVPFPLGVRVANKGYGPARNLKIESSQPKIIENELGLLIGFEIIGSEVGGQPVTTGLLADFGTIDPGTAKNARWYMTSTLQGKFVEFTASFSHADELGGKLTSLMEEVNTHTLVRDVLVQAPGRDIIRDFLAVDDGQYRVFESDSVSFTEVFEVESPTLTPISGSTYTLATGAVGGFLYAQVADPLAGQSALTQVVRGDGRVLDPANAWQSKVWVKQSQSYLHYVNIFDENNTQPWAYTVTFGGAIVANFAPVLGSLPDRSVAVGDTLTYSVTATDVNAGDALAITASPLPSGAVLTDHGNGSATLAWTPTAGQVASYPIEFAVYDGALFDTHVATLAVVPAGTENHPPTSASASLVAEKNHASAPVTPTVVDMDSGDVHFYSIVAPPQYGEASVVDNQLVYVPDPNFAGTDSFVFAAADPFGESVEGTASVIVTDGDDLMALGIALVGDPNDPIAAIASVENDGTIATILPVTTRLYAHTCAGATEIGSVSQVLGSGTNDLEFPIDLASYGDAPVVLVAVVDAEGELPEVDEFNNRAALGVLAGEASATSLSLASAQAAPVSLCAGETFGATGRSHFVLHESSGTCLGPMAGATAVSYEMEELASSSIVRQGTVWADGNGAWHLEFGLPAAAGVTYALRMTATDGASSTLLTRTFSTQACAPAIPPPMVAAPPYPGPYGDAPTVRFSEPGSQLPWLVYPGMAIPSSGPGGSGTFGHTHGTGASASVPAMGPAIGSQGGAVPPALLNASLDPAALSFDPAALLVAHATTLHGVVEANDSLYGLPVEWHVTEPSGESWQIAPATWLYANGPLHVIATFTPRQEGSHTFELRLGSGHADAAAEDDAAQTGAIAGPDPNATTPALLQLTPAQALRGTSLSVAVSGAHLTADATLDCGGQGLEVAEWTVILDEGDVTFGSTAIAMLTVAPDASLGLRDCTLTTAFGSSTLVGAFWVLETLCDNVTCDAPPPSVCYEEGSGECDVDTGTCTYTLLAAGAPCDDVFECTAGGMCDGAGTCGVPKSLDCNDGIPCTTELCDSQSGCLNQPVTPDCNAAGCLTGGDVNGTNAVNVSDAMCLIFVSLWAATPNNPAPRPACMQGPLEVADANCNGAINVSDVQLVIQWALGAPLPAAIDADANGCVDSCQP